jgi:hypothetical protein
MVCLAAHTMPYAEFFLLTIFVFFAETQRHSKKQGVRHFTGGGNKAELGRERVSNLYL